MSTEYGSIKSVDGPDPNEREMHLTRFWGGTKNGMCMQLTIGELFVQLDYDGARELHQRLTDAFGGFPR